MQKLQPDVKKSLGQRNQHLNLENEKLVTILEDEKKKRLHAYIPASLHKKLKLRGVQEGRDMTELVTAALEAYLD